MLDARRARKDQSASQVAAVKAALTKAELDLSHTQVRAPISGRLSNALITAGNYVQAGQSQLTSIVSTDRMYAVVGTESPERMARVAAYVRQIPK